MVSSLAVLGVLALAHQAPPAQPFEALPPPADPAPLVRQLGDKPSEVWLDGDVLTFVTRAEKGPVSLAGGIQTELKPMPGTNLWVGRFRRSDWEQAYVSYIFLGPEPPTRVEFRYWRGPKAPAPARKADAVEVTTFDFESKHLGEARKVSVFRPKGVEGPLPVFILADGQGTEEFAKVLQALIDEGKVRPAAIVGIHSGTYRGDRTKPYEMELDYRASEYLPSGKRFAQHLDFVTEELLPDMARRYSLSIERNDLCLVGFSNGGAFAAAAAMARPDRFGAAMPMSVGVPPSKPEAHASPPRLFFAAGELEPGFLRGTRQTEETAKAWGATTELRAHLAGHDPEMWQIAFAEFAPKVFPPK